MPTPLDEEHLADLAELMGDELGSLVDAYLHDSSERMRQLDLAYTAGDFEGVRRQAHSLKGSSSNLGAQQLAELCLQLEQLAIKGPEAQRLEAYAAVRSALNDVHQHLRQRFR